MRDPHPGLTEFRKYIGVREIKGPETDPTILRMIDAADGKLDQVQLQGIRDDETPYCSSFKCGVYELAGIESPRSAWARDWTKWGIKLGGPAVGATYVKKRGAGGHVGDVVGRDATGNLMILGANQRDAVNISPFHATQDLLGFYWPKGFELPVVGMKYLPIIESSGRVLRPGEQA